MPYPLLNRVLFSATVLVGAFFFSQSLDAQPRPSNEATFYTFAIQQAEPQPRLTLSNVAHAKGEFKIPDLGKAVAHEEGMLVFVVTDAAGSTVYETECANPLEERLERVDEKGELGIARVQQQNGTVDVRFPFDTTPYSITVYSAEAGNRLVLLANY